jgi:hypothetical protein
MPPIRRGAPAPKRQRIQSKSLGLSCLTLPDFKKRQAAARPPIQNSWRPKTSSIKTVSLSYFIPFSTYSDLSLVPAFAAYGRKEFQGAVKHNIRGGTFDVIPEHVVRARMKKSDARILARVKRFIDDPRFPVSSF